MDNGVTEARIGDEPTPRTRKKTGVITRDAETTALVRIFKMLDELDADPQARIIAYINEKYGEGSGE